MKISSFPQIVSTAAAMLAVVAATHPASAADPTPKVLQADHIRVSYHTEGLHAVDATDRNGNRIPDQVEDLLTQTRAARDLWVEVLGYPDPFKTKRFKTAKFLDIHIRNKSVLKTNGSAYDELQRFNRAGDPKGTLSICFNVASSVDPKSNLTPAHEYFHLIQFGTNFFKNRWYTEGLARWSEGALGLAKESTQRAASVWPVSAEQRATLSTTTYDAAAAFWEPLLRKYDPTTQIPESPRIRELQALKYTDGSPVLKDLHLAGWKFVRELFKELGKIDEVAFRELGYDRWSEENQKSPKNDEYILKAIETVIQRGPLP